MSRSSISSITLAAGRLGGEKNKGEGERKKRKKKGGKKEKKRKDEITQIVLKATGTRIIVGCVPEWANE